MLCNDVLIIIVIYPNIITLPCLPAPMHKADTLCIKYNAEGLRFIVQLVLWRGIVKEQSR